MLRVIYCSNTLLFFVKSSSSFCFRHKWKYKKSLSCSLLFLYFALMQKINIFFHLIMLLYIRQHPINCNTKNTWQLVITLIYPFTFRKGIFYWFNRNNFYLCTVAVQMHSKHSQSHKQAYTLKSVKNVCHSLKSLTL